ncbi:MAG: hypothetical protein IPN95_01955 [Bacteroidetes bacterium]|nr:hypothetical protein [Bacteroidota bacterium]
MTRSCNKYRTGFPPLWLVFLGIAFFGTALGQMPISSSETGDSLGQIRQAVGLELLKEKALDPFIVSKRAYIEKFGSEPHHRVVLKQALKCNKILRLREQIYMPIPGDSFLFHVLMRRTAQCVSHHLEKNSFRLRHMIFTLLIFAHPIVGI